MDISKNNLDWPIICVLGKIGKGKSLSETFIAKLFEHFLIQNNLTKAHIFSNLTLYDINYWKKVKAKDIVKMPLWLQDGILILDEMHSEGGDRYNFMSPVARKIDEFVGQIRKRNLALIYSAQVYSQIMKGLRDLTYYFFVISKTIEGLTKIEIVAREGYTKLNEFVLDLSDFYNNYDTKELITLEDMEELNKYE